MEFGGASEDFARICHAHPTHSEGLKEAGWATFSKALHI
jgi:dihydrolipoamide dehydrogenase